MRKPFLLLVLTAFLAPSFVSADEPSSAPAPERVVASSFGFDAADSTDFLQAAIDSGAKTVVVDKRDAGPWVVRPLKLRSDLELVLEEGAEIVAKPGAFRLKGECLLTANGVRNSTIRGEGSGATLRMRKRDYWAEPYDKSEWRHGLSILSSENVRVENLTISETGGDGIYVGVSTPGVPCRDVVIRDVDCIENNRQGISVISVDGLLIENCRLNDTNGTAPEAGIDFEPNLPDEQISRVVMRNVVCENNAGDGFAFYLPNMKSFGADLSVEMDGCRAIRNAAGGLTLTVANGEERTLPGAFVVKNSEFLGNRLGVAVRSKWADGAPLSFENVSITTPSADPQADPAKLAAWGASIADSGLAFIAVGTDVDANGAFSFRDVEIIDAGDKPLLTFRDASSDGVGFEKVDGTIKSTNATTGETTEIALNDSTIKTLFPDLAARRVAPFDFARLAGSDPTDKAISAELAAAWVSDAAPKPTGTLKARGFDAFYFWAEAGAECGWSLKLGQVGNYPLKSCKPELTEPTGETTKLPDVPSDGSALKYAFKAKNTGWHKVAVEFGQSYLVVSDATTPILTAARPNLNLIGTTGDYWFYVPKGTTDLGVRVVGSAAERVTASLFDPSGAEVWREENIPALATWTAPQDPATGEIAAPAPGFWRIRFDRPTVGVLEDVVLTITGVPALIR